jgi:hypothetical protein
MKYSDRLKEERKTFSENTDSTYAKHLIFGEVFGNGILLSLNYEYMINQTLGIRIGCGASYGVGATVPVMINYHSPKELSLELGGGIVYLPVWDFYIGSEESFLFTSCIGYKYQPKEGGLMMKFAFTPLYDIEQRKGWFLGGVSLGVAF